MIFPTDTVYGLAVLPIADDALEHVFRLKERPRDRSIAVLVADAKQAEGLVEFGGQASLLADRHWPGALTLVLPLRADYVGPLGAEDRTLGVRCPDHAFVRELARRVGPLATTSANKHQMPTPHTARAAAEQLADDVDAIIDGGEVEGLASTVVRIGNDGSVEVLRRGDVNVDSRIDE